jgi:MFS transporter, ACS family, glucarate transporter
MKPSRTRYSVVALALGLAILSYIQRVAISEAATPISRDLHLSKQAMGLIFGAFGLSYALFELPAGLLGDRIGVRRVLVRIVLAWSTFTALTGAAWNVVSLYIVRFLFGAGEAGCFPNLTRMLSVWLPARERMKAQGIMWACTRWGGAITPPLALLAISFLGWRWAFVCFAGLGLVWCVLFLFWYRDDPVDHPKVNAAERELLQSSRVLTTHRPGEGNWVALLFTRQVLLLVVQYFCFSYVWYFYVTWLPMYLREARGQTAAHAAALSVLPLLLGGFGSLGSGMLPKRISRRAIAFFGFLSTAILLFVFMRIHAALGAMVAMGFASFASDLTMPISWDACVDIGGAYTATVAASMNMLGNLAGFVAPVVGGVILQRTGGDWNMLIYTMVAAAMVSSLCWLGLHPENAARAQEARVRELQAESASDSLSL